MCINLSLSIVCACVLFNVCACLLPLPLSVCLLVYTLYLTQCLARAFLSLYISLSLTLFLGGFSLWGQRGKEKLLTDKFLSFSWCVVWQMWANFCILAFLWDDREKISHATHKKIKKECTHSRVCSLFFEKSRHTRTLQKRSRAFYNSRAR